MQKLNRLFLVLSILFAVISVDQTTKRIAELEIKHNAMTLLAGTVRLEYAENRGAFGSLGANWPTSLRFFVFMLLPLLVLGGIAAYVLRNDTLHLLEVASFALILGGGLGNLIDRFLLGYVVDFMWCGVGGIGTNIFNVADMGIMSGMIGLLYHHFMYKRNDKEKSSNG